MSQIKYTVLLVLICTALLSCSKEGEEMNQLSSKILVEGYVFANEPIKIKAARVNENGLSVSSAIANANVKVIQGNLEIPFMESDSIPGTYYQLNQNQLLEDTGTIKLSVNYNGNTHQAQTSFPQKISNLEISTSDIELLPADLNATIATVSWSPVADAAGYCIFLKNSIVYPELILSSDLFDPYQNHFFKINHETSINLTSTDFAYVGNYYIYVSAIGAEYAAMYHGFGLSNLISAPSNIENGWGVFTAFNGQSVSVTVH